MNTLIREKSEKRTEHALNYRRGLRPYHHGDSALEVIPSEIATMNFERML